MLYKDFSGILFNREKKIIIDNIKEKAKVEEDIGEKLPKDKISENSDSSVEYFTYGEPT